MSWRILTGDVRDVLKTLPDQSVQCVVTSPPYWGLRDYGHTGQIGLEPTVHHYITEIASLFSHDYLWRVLKDDGTVWLNLGDSYAGSWGAQSREHAGKHAPNISAISANQVKAASIRESRTGSLGRVPGLKAKDLVGVPWRVAFAIQDRGWYLRSDIIWAKPNPMPESVTDRPTKSHEYIFLLSKSASYYYDAAAIAEPVSEAMLQQMQDGYDGEGTKDYAGAGVQNPSSVKSRIIEKARAKNIVGNMSDRGVTRTTEGLNLKASWEKGNGITRNARTVWEITTQPYPAAHFATFPEALPERCIKAGSRPGDVILDPFCGAGTTGLVADRLGRDFIGVELNPAYVELARERINSVTPLFPNEVSA